MRASGPIDKLLRDAIAQKRRLILWYDGFLRDVEPHDYGLKDGQIKVLCYQVGGGSRSGKLPEWRTLAVVKITSAELAVSSFPGAREVPSEHIEWDELYASVSRPPSSASKK
jgi:hypothetical protein